jgi:hypothetical protein
MIHTEEQSHTPSFRTRSHRSECASRLAFLRRSFSAWRARCSIGNSSVVICRKHKGVSMAAPCDSSWQGGSSNPPAHSHRTLASSCPPALRVM